MTEIEKRKKEIGDKAYKLGFTYEQDYHGCAQCVVAALQDVFDINNDDIFKTMTGCGGGGGGLCNGSCGAYVGGIVILSWLRGRERKNYSDVDVSETYALVRKLHQRFIDKYGTVICRDINTRVFGRPYYTADPEEYARFQEAGAYDSKCTDVVGDAARWVAEIILEENLLAGR